MKKVLTVAASLVAVIAAFAAGPVTISWTYTNTPPEAFKLYTSTNITVPLTNWTLVGSVSGNVHAINLTNIANQQAWFFVTATNYFGERFPTNVVGTAQLLDLPETRISQP